MNNKNRNSSEMEEWIGTKCHYSEEKDLSDFYRQMNQDIVRTIIPE